MNFMRIITHGPGHASFNMAMDEAISEAVRQRLSPPTLRLYEWDRPSLSIGYFQKMSDIDIDYCSKKKYPVVRRLTGGRAILHDSELTYSVSSLKDNSLFKGSLLENYKTISNAMISGLKLIGIEAEMSFERKRSSVSKNPSCFHSVSFGEITAEGKKIIGSAQKRYSGGFLQHGSVLLNFDADILCRVLKENNTGEFKDIGVIKDFNPGISFEDLKNSFKEAFEKELNIKLISDDPTKFELNLAKELEQKKYSNREWNFKR